MDENPTKQHDDKEELSLPEKATQLDPKILIGVVGLLFRMRNQRPAFAGLFHNQPRPDMRRNFDSLP